jgi:hypothetical protein
VPRRDPPPAIYANLVNVRTTPNELVLEFATHFPETPDPAKVGDVELDARIVMHINALNILAESLTKAAQAVKKASEQVPAVPAVKAH